MQDLTATEAFETGSVAARQKAARTQVASKAGAGWSFLFLLLFTVAVYARPQDIYPSLIVLHLPLVFGVCGSAAYLTALLSGNTSFYFPRELQIILVLTFWYMAGIPFAFWKTGSMQVFTGIWLKTLFALFLLTQTLVTLKRIRLLIWTVILSESIVTAITLLDQRHASWSGQRLGGLNLGFFGWNYFGIAVGMTIPYVAVLFLCRRSAVKTTGLAATCFCLMWMLVLTASRGGLLTVSLSIVLTFILILRHSSRGRKVLAMVILSLFIALVKAPPVLWERTETLWTDSGFRRNSTGG